MPRPSQAVIDLSKAYAYRLEKGWTPTRAREYIRDNFGATEQQVRDAVANAQRGLKIAEKISYLPNKSKLREALVGQKEPEQTVGVRVLVEVTHPGRASTWATIYVNATWDWTVEEVEAEARRLAIVASKNYGRVGPMKTAFVGPTLWGL
jgi:hypothetical protein